MTHLLIIAAYVSLHLRDVPSMRPVAMELGFWQSLGVTLGGFALLAVWTDLMVRLRLRRIDRRGRGIDVFRAMRSSARARTLATVWLAVSVVVFGWLEAVRSVVGDPVLLDELLSMLPLFVVWACSWWSVEPVERRLREATLLRRLDEGLPVGPGPSRWVFVLDAMRHQVLLILVPLMFAASWIETLEKLSMGDGRIAMWLQDDLVRLGATLAGLLVVFAFAPMLLRMIWDTTPLGDGAIRARLRNLGERHGVGLGRLLIWRTHGTVLNAAVTGLFPGVRAVLLSDALVDQLDERQIEAVAAHEVGHIRRRHIPWLAGAAIVLLTGVSVVVSMLVFAVWGPIAMDDWRGAAAIALGLLAGMAVFGVVSRRFEWQADAFAAQHMSGLSTARGASDPEIHIREDAADAMVGALERVAIGNGIAPERRSWRHGSIRRRQRNLEKIVGLPALALPIDRQVRIVKIAIILCGVITVLLLAAHGSLN
ncbi:MAG: hypothetical protein EA423_08220 [Phycisphaerales bacterium]|nr:MAG: hypothetical protein EA423_08220 [Phycisphaerales bacterium]